MYHHPGSSNDINSGCCCKDVKQYAPRPTGGHHQCLCQLLRALEILTGMEYTLSRLAGRRKPHPLHRPLGCSSPPAIDGNLFSQSSLGTRERTRVRDSAGSRDAIFIYSCIKPTNLPRRTTHSIFSSSHFQSSSPHGRDFSMPRHPTVDRGPVTRPVSPLHPTESP